MNSIILSLLNLKAQDEARFSLMMTQGPFEVRLYQKLLCARVSLPGSFEEVLKEGMRHLSEYLEGTNFKVKKILHAGPLFQLQKNNDWEIGMVLPSEWNLLNIPKPISRYIKIEEWSPHTAGVLRYRGGLTPEVFQRKGEELKRWIKMKGLNSMGPVRVSRHDHFLAVPFFRPNEVHLDIV